MPRVRLVHTVYDLTAPRRAELFNSLTASAPLLFVVLFGKDQENRNEAQNMEVGCQPKKWVSANQVLVVVSSGQHWARQKITPPIIEDLIWFLT